MEQTQKYLQEFKSQIEAGFGKIYSEDIPKYWVLCFGETPEDDEIMFIEEELSNLDLIITED